MKHRVIFRAPARVERRSKVAKAWKVGANVQTDTEDLGYFIVATLGTQEFAFYHGDKVVLANPTIDLIVEFEVPDAK